MTGEEFNWCYNHFNLLNDYQQELLIDVTEAITESIGLPDLFGPNYCNNVDYIIEHTKYNDIKLIDSFDNIRGE